MVAASQKLRLLFRWSLEQEKSGWDRNRVGVTPHTHTLLTRRGRLLTGSSVRGETEEMGIHWNSADHWLISVCLWVSLDTWQWIKKLILNLNKGGCPADAAHLFSSCGLVINRRHFTLLEKHHPRHTRLFIIKRVLWPPICCWRKCANTCPLGLWQLPSDLSLSFLSANSLHSAHVQVRSSGYPLK